MMDLGVTMMSTERSCAANKASDGETGNKNSDQKFAASVTRDRCYDFLNIFAEKFCEKMAFLAQNKAKFGKKFIITLVLKKNANFFPKIGKNRRKL
jgi:predicted secreted acid phosphatase